MDDKDIIRDSISELLLDSGVDDDDIDSQTLTFKRTPSTITNAEIVTLEQSRKKAEGVIKSLLRVYLSEKFISKNEYARAKENLDSMTLGNIMNQMEISQRAINVLMENIEIGDVNPKLFDALGKLQTTFIELVKTQANYIISAGNEYEKLASENDCVSTESGSTAKDISSGYKSNNQKDLMRLIRSATTKDDK